MRITKSHPGTPVVRRSWWIWSVILVLVFGAGLLAASAGWYARLGIFVGAFLEEPGAVLRAWRTRAEIPTLTLDVAFDDYQRLYTRVARAVQTGANVISETAYVPATLTYDRQPAAVDLRLPEGAAALFSGEHWPLEIFVRDGHPLLTMYGARLSPVDEGSLHAQLYLAMLRDVGLPVPVRRYVRLMVNGTDWGVYVLEAVPSTAMLVEAGFLSESVVVFFDQRDYLSVPPGMPGDSFAYARIGVTRGADLSREAWQAALGDDPTLATIYADVVRLLRGVECGEYAPSDVFEPEALARFLAVTTFWHGSPFLDWRTLRLAYDPATRRFTPIGTGDVVDPATPLPSVFTNDPAIQRAYVQALQAFSQPEFSEAMRAAWDLDGSSLKVAVAVGHSLPDQHDFDRWQARIREIVSPSRTLFARATDIDGAVHLRLDAVLPFPVEVVSLEFDARGDVPIDRGWAAPEMGSPLETGSEAGMVLRARAGDVPVRADLRVPWSVLPAALQGGTGEFRVVTRIWGLVEEITVPVEWGVGE